MNLRVRYDYNLGENAITSSITEKDPPGVINKSGKSTDSQHIGSKKSKYNSRYDKKKY